MKHSELRRKALALTLSAATLASAASLGSVTVSAADENSVPSKNYGEALAMSLYFFDSNACGTGITDGPLTWRGDCHAYDGQAQISQAVGFPSAAKSILDPDGDGKVDVSGGYHDAGDHVKFNLTIGFSMSCLAASDYLNEGVYKKAGCMDHFAYVLKHGADYLMKTTALDGSGNVVGICYQVSDLSDHSYWTAPETQTYERKTYWMTAGNNNQKIAADMANGLGGTAYALRDYDPEYSAKCLKYAKAIFDFAKANKGNNQEGNGGMYGNNADAQDELLIAQTWLYLNGAGSQPTCVPNSKQYQSEFGSEYDGYILSWDKQYQLYSAMMLKITKDEAYRKELIAEWNDQNGLKVGEYNKKWGWGNSRYNCAVQMTSLAIAGGDKSSDYALGAKYQMNFILGENDLGYSFLLGYGNKWPTHIHHRAANPGENGQTSAANPSAKYTNYGMLVGGIDSGGYQDHADKYEYTEGALDYNACFALACAGLYELYGGDASAMNDIAKSASEINDSFVFGSGSSATETTTTTTTTTTETTTTTTTTSFSDTGSQDPPRGVRGDADCNGEFMLADAVLTARAIVGLENITVEGKRNVDLDGSEGLTEADLKMLLKALAGLITL